MNFSIKVPNIKYRKSQKLYFLPYSNSRGIPHKIYPKNNRKTAFSHQTPHLNPILTSVTYHVSPTNLFKSPLHTQCRKFQEFPTSHTSEYTSEQHISQHQRPKLFQITPPTLLILKPYINSPQKPVFYETQF